MGLQVWLPLNGNIQNQGLINGTTEKGTYISFTNGKIGQCATSSSSNNTIRLTSTEFPSMFANGNAYTLTCWVKVTGNADNGWIVKIGSNTCGLWWAKSVARLVWNENDNGKRIASSPIADDYTNWHHIASVIDKTISGNITARHYIDGVLSTENGTTTWDCSSHSQPAGNYIDIYPYNALINDVRIYDHALSPREVKEISKGLVLHLPLNRGGFGQSNFVIDSGPEYISPPIEEGSNSSYSKIYYLDDAGKAAVTEGAVLTISFDYEIYGATAGYIYAQLNGSQILPAGGQNIELVSEKPFGRYVKKVQVSETQASYTNNTFWVRARLYGSGVHGIPETGAYFRIRNVKLELGDKATPWCPNEADDLYSKMGLDNNIEYDVSGYGHNGTKTGAFAYDADTPRYNTSTRFNLTDTRITPPIIFQSDVKIPEISFSFWMKRNNYTDAKTHFIYSDICQIYTYSDYLLRISWKHDTESSSKGNTSANSSAITTPNEWHHICYTFDKGYLRLYIDGEFIYDSDRTGTGQFMGVYNFGSIGYASGSNSSYGGCLSDFRIYATALSADDVRDLYSVAASISDNGTLMASEVSEL